MKAPVRPLEIAGRTLVAVPFIFGGLAYYEDRPGRVALVKKLGYPRPAATAMIDAVAKLGGGLALISGVRTDLVGSALIANLGLTTVSMFPFWSAPDPGTLATQRNNFVMNVALAGGLLGIISRHGRR